MSRVRAAAVVAAVAAMLALGAAASAQLPPRFADGAGVARALERHYNGPAFKRPLAKAGGRVVGRVLCAHDPALRLVECTGRLRVRSVAIRAEWELVKRTRVRARLRWTYIGRGVFQADSEIVRPRAFGLRRF